MLVSQLLLLNKKLKPTIIRRLDQLSHIRRTTTTTRSTEPQEKEKEKEKEEKQEQKQETTPLSLSLSSSSSAGSPDQNQAKLLSHHLSSSTATYLKPLERQLKAIQTNLSGQFADLPTKLSQLTGYGEIDQLKALVSKAEADLRASRDHAAHAKIKFNLAAQRRAESIKEVNDLLARKASWSDQDLARFTTLVRTDHSNEQAESEAKKSLQDSEAQVDHQFTSMMQAILTRYHEEQVWSDKIRALSTTFSLSITLINVLVFLAAIVLVEPYKRSKVVSEVEERIVKRDMNNADVLDRALNAVVDRLSSTEKQLSDLVLSLQVPVALPSPSSTVDVQDQIDIRSVPGPSPELNQVEEFISDPIARSRLHMPDSEMERSTPEAMDDPRTERRPQQNSPLNPSPSWYAKFHQAKEDWLESHEYSDTDPNSLKVIGLGTLVGVILLGSYHLLSK
ncbi:hypothetical protein PCANC_20811 [Puccinia coronata f. sp. avenae]|uniref:Sensitive to high expression protein 9, mitochondrial n=1 Tax=Puccinia coronata f. sp. avenae TaxID=200324 RepID=A0A2N5TSC9_9BASI|nr:hypothetical protein PCANC_20811 [Puccinia coronata f. sp. avenae]